MAALSSWPPWRSKNQPVIDPKACRRHGLDFSTKSVRRAQKPSIFPWRSMKIMGLKHVKKKTWKPIHWWIRSISHWRKLENFRILKWRPIFLGQCKGISPQNMARNMVLTYLHFRILEISHWRKLGIWIWSISPTKMCDVYQQLS